MIVSIHIPKTAGTALAKIFDDTSLRKVMYDYGTERDLVAVRTCLPEIKEHKAFILAYFKYLHGHFHYLKYADVFSDCPFVATVRNPVDRVISQYLHILRGGDVNNVRHKAIMDGKMDVVDFSRVKFIGNAQWFYLEGRPVMDYDFIFVQERMQESLDIFCDKFNKPEIREYLSWHSGVPVVNEKPAQSAAQKKSVKITEDQKKQILKHCEMDMEVYRLACEKLDRLARAAA